MRSPVQDRAHNTIMNTLLRLHDEGVEDDVLRECLFDALNKLLQPPQDLTPQSGTAYYLQLHRFKDGLQARCDEISALYEDDMQADDA